MKTYALKEHSQSHLMQSNDCIHDKDGEGNGIPLQYFCLENPMDGGAW